MLTWGPHVELRVSAGYFEGPKARQHNLLHDSVFCAGKPPPWMLSSHAVCQRNEAWYVIEVVDCRWMCLRCLMWMLMVASMGRRSGPRMIAARKGPGG